MEKFINEISKLEGFKVHKLSDFQIIQKNKFVKSLYLKYLQEPDYEGLKYYVKG